MLSLLLLAACGTSDITVSEPCPLGTPVLSPSVATPGRTVHVAVSPLTEVWDTAVTVGDARATVVGIDRSTCEDCDDCRDTGGCSACGSCAECDEACAGCVETVRFVVPDLAPGTYRVEVVNSHGRSALADLVIPFTVDGTEPSRP